MRNGTAMSHRAEEVHAEAHRLASSDPFRRQSFRPAVATQSSWIAMKRYSRPQLLVLESGLIPGHPSVGERLDHLEASTDQTFNGQAARQCRQCRADTDAAAGAQTSSISHSFRRKAATNRLGEQFVVVAPPVN